MLLLLFASSSSSSSSPFVNAFSAFSFSALVVV